MNKLLKLNPFFSFKKKNGVYVFYFDYDFIFLKGQATILMDLLFEMIDKKNMKNIKEIPESFIKYLLDHGIIMEVEDENS